MTRLNDMRLQLLVQQEQERIKDSQPKDIDLSIIQARCLCWLSLLFEAHEDQANDAERRKDTEQAMGWFADAHRLRDVINLVTSIEIPYLEETYISENEIIDEESCTKPVRQENTSTNYSSQLSNTSMGIDKKEDKNKLENTQILKKIDALSDSYETISSNIEELLKLNNRKLDQIDIKLFEKKQRKQELTNNNVCKDEEYAKCLEWAEKTFHKLKTRSQ